MIGHRRARRFLLVTLIVAGRVILPPASFWQCPPVTHSAAHCVAARLTNTTSGKHYVHK